MNNIQIPVNSPLIKHEDINSVIRSLQDGWISGESPEIKKFEDSVAENCNRKNALAVCNGTVAIDLAFEALGISKGDEVIVPAFTIISCISYLLRVGAVPVFIDADPFTWNMDITKIENSITDKTKAILVVHIYGLTVDMDPVVEIAVRHNLRIVEDAAEAFGQTYGNQPCGSFGDISTFSFYANKNITTGEGGMVLTNDTDIAKTIDGLRNLNFRNDDRFVNDYLGYNYRMSSMQAALGNSQLPRIKEIIARRIEIASYYSSEFKNMENIQLPLRESSKSLNHFWVYGIKLTGRLQGKAKQYQSKLNQAGIGTRPFFQALNTQPVLGKFGLANRQTMPISEELSKSGFYIPNGLGMTDSEIEIVAKKVKEIVSV